MKVFVISKSGKPLMPTCPAIARLLLKTGKDKCIRVTPFTIKMLVETTEYTQPVEAGMDTAGKIMGCAAKTNGEVVYMSEVILRDDIHRKMVQRKMYRSHRRYKKTRYRPMRYSNRISAKTKGRMAPSIKSKVDSHLREKSFMESILPNVKWTIEIAKFDLQKINNPDIKGREYQNGPMKDYYNINAYVLNRDNYKCQKCKGKNKDNRLHVHHIIWRSIGGTDGPSNRITLCKTCHDRLHNGEFDIKGSKSKSKYASEVSMISSQLQKYFGEHKETFGYETKYKREQILGLQKEHYFDAVAICCNDNEKVKVSNVVYIKRHVSAGDYRQTNGKRSEKKIPTGKLFGLRKYDLIKTKKGIGWISGKRSEGFFELSEINGNSICHAINIKKYNKRISARSTTLVSMVNSNR